MAAGGPGGDWRFLFREEPGVIDAPTWRRGFVVLAAPLLAMTVVWLALLPYANRSLDERPLLDPLTFVVYAYLMAFAAAILLGSICLYFLSAKRWRELGAPPALTAIPLILGLVWGGAAWLQPRAEDVVPWAFVAGCGVVWAIVAIWQVYRLGFCAAHQD